MFQLRLIHIPRPSSKQIILGSLGGSVVIVGIILAVPFFIVETIIHPKKKTLFDCYTISPFELDIPAEVVTFPPLCRDYKVSGWYIVRVQGCIQDIPSLRRVCVHVCGHTQDNGRYSKCNLRYRTLPVSSLHLIQGRYLCL